MGRYLGMTDNSSSVDLDDEALAEAVRDVTEYLNAAVQLQSVGDRLPALGLPALVITEVDRLDYRLVEVLRSRGKTFAEIAVIKRWEDKQGGLAELIKKYQNDRDFVGGEFMDPRATKG